jgi:predicted MPP superfamily phosphohydrolase
MVYSILVFALFWLGHACLWMWAMNVAYSRPLPRDFLKFYRLLTGLVIWFGPPLFGVLVTFDIPSLFQYSATSVPALYAALCLFVSCVVLPVVTVGRLLRPTPSAVLDESTQTFDLVKELGEKPVGDGKYRKLAALPGNHVFRVDFTTLTLAIPELPPAWDGMTILHLSDLHFIGTPSRRFYEWIIRKCVADGVPDVVALTGDIVDTGKHHRWIIPLLGRLRWKEAAFAILGNHDYWHDTSKIRRRLRRLGMHELGNRWEVVPLRGVPAVVIGHEGPWFRPDPDLSDCPADLFRICLSHTPDNIGWCKSHNVSLMLSGHVHGGQIRLPVFGSIFVPSWYSRKYDMGVFHEPPTVLHVSRGLSGKEPLRFRCHPQVVRIVLKCG